MIPRLLMAAGTVVLVLLMGSELMQNLPADWGSLISWPYGQAIPPEGVILGLLAAGYGIRRTWRPPGRSPF